MPAFVLTIREGIEAVLVVSILLGALRRLGRMELRRFVWLGVGAALALSIAVAAALGLAGISFEGRGEQLFEGTTLLVAAILITGMLFWMRQQGPQLGARLSSAVRRATEGAPGTMGQGAGYTGLSLFMVAFLAVLREGIELALLLAATAFSTSIVSTATGAFFGLALAAGLGILLFFGVVHLNLKRFFQVTNVILVLFAAGMVALAVHEFIEAGLLPGILEPVWNLNPVLSDQSTGGELLKTLFGYSSAPALTQVLAYVVYLALVGGMLWSGPRRHAGTAAA